MVWATARSAPISAYLELEAQPDPKIEYTARLDNARINSMLRLRSVTASGMGRGAHRVKASVSARVGAATKRKGEEVEGRTGSLIKSLIPSAMGWSNP